MTIKILQVVVFFLFVFFNKLNAQTDKQIAYNSKTNLDASNIILNNVSSSAFDIYDSWNNTMCHPKIISIPKMFEIDLRKFSMPIKQRIITSNYGKRWGRNHNGIDIKAQHGDSIYSTFGGKVRIVKNDPNGYGKVIVIRHWNGLETVYGHLSKQIVRVNDIVEVGQVIGLAGNTGRSTGTHLHFETRFCGVPINPLEIFSFQFQDVTDDFYIWKKK